MIVLPIIALFSIIIELIIMKKPSIISCCMYLFGLLYIAGRMYSINGLNGYTIFVSLSAIFISVLFLFYIDE